LNCQSTDLITAFTTAPAAWIFAAILRASSLLSSLAVDRWSGSCFLPRAVDHDKAGANVLDRPGRREAASSHLFSPAKSSQCLSRSRQLAAASLSESRASSSLARSASRSQYAAFSAHRFAVLRHSLGLTAPKCPTSESWRCIPGALRWVSGLGSRRRLQGGARENLCRLQR
jgi:hypothetical protein